MAFAQFDRILETTTTTGTGDVTLLGAVTGFFTFASVYSNGSTFDYCISQNGSALCEWGTGTYNSGANSISRTTVLGGSSGTSHVNFTAGTYMVRVVSLAEHEVLSSNVGTSGQVLTSGGAGVLPSYTTISVPTGANPSGTIGATAVNGSASTFMRSDGAPPLAIASLTGKTTPTGADTLALADSAAANALKSLTWTNLLTAVGAYIATLTQTLTNKRITKRVVSATSSATPTINTDNTDLFKLTAQAVNITSMTTNLSGTPNDGDPLEIRITATGTVSITWGASFSSSTAILPITTNGTATLNIILEWQTDSNTFVCLGVS